jgi:hypothetical protein
MRNKVGLFVLFLKHKTMSSWCCPSVTLRERQTSRRNVQRGGETESGYEAIIFDTHCLTYSRFTVVLIVTTTPNITISII